MYVCEVCGSDDIEQKEWRKVNTGSYIDLAIGDTQDQWCPTCQEHVEFITEEEFEKKKTS